MLASGIGLILVLKVAAGAVFAFYSWQVMSSLIRGASGGRPNYEDRSQMFFNRFQAQKRAEEARRAQSGGRGNWRERGGIWG